MKTLTILFTFYGLISCQIYFPNDNMPSSSMQNNMLANLPIRPDQTRGAYEEMVDEIISKGITKLTLSIAKSLANSPDQKECIVFAPINIAGALAMILLASSGKTFQEISNVMGLATGVDINSKSQLVHVQFGRILKKLDEVSTFEIGDEITLANALFVQDGFPIRDVYKKIGEHEYRSEILSVDFVNNGENAKSVINAWVNDRTKGKITQMIEDTPSTDTRVIITAALYFKAAWEQPFYKGFTHMKPFYANGRGTQATRMVNMMANGGHFPYYQDNLLDCQIMGFPYKGNKTVMYVVIPNDSNQQKLLNLQKRLTPENVEHLVSNTKYKKSVIMFPKMNVESHIELETPLQELGVRSLFVKGEANLALLSPGEVRINRPYSGPPQSGLGLGNGGFGGAGFVSNINKNPTMLNRHDGEEPSYIFSRMGTDNHSTQNNCTTNATKCENEDTTKKQVTYKKRVTRNVRRKSRQVNSENLDNLRLILTEKDNPGLYVDRVTHKVYMDITELGTEAAASTSATLTRNGDYVSFKADVPFLFFIRNQDTKIIMFWGTVLTPTPNYENQL